MESNLFLLFLRPLDRAGVRYAVTGSVAGMIYGEPRLTHDIDLVVELALDQIGELVQQFPEDEFYVPPAEVIAVEVQRAQRGHFNLIHQATGFKADLYPRGRDPLHTWALDSARTVELEGATIRVAPPEYVIVRKLEYYREGGSEKHLRDIVAMLAQLGDGVDRAELVRLVESLGLAAQWARVRGG
jgi:hypothetical protein